MPVTLNEIYDAPGHLLRRAYQIAAAVAQEELGKFELTAPQHVALVGIRDNPGVDITKLAGLIALDRSTLGGVLDRLESKELIFRQALKTDKRLKLLYVTREGDALLTSTEGLMTRTRERILEPLAATERKQLLALLKKLVRLQTANLPPSLKNVVERIEP